VERGQVGCRPERFGKARPDAVLNRQLHSHRLGHHQDITEDDGSVDAYYVNRL
jgi:hypothetical protein